MTCLACRRLVPLLAANHTLGVHHTLSAPQPQPGARERSRRAGAHENARDSESARENDAAARLERARLERARLERAPPVAPFPACVRCGTELPVTRADRELSRLLTPQPSTEGTLIALIQPQYSFNRALIEP